MSENTPTYGDAVREIMARLMFDEPPLATTKSKAELITHRVLDGLNSKGALNVTGAPTPQPTSLDEFRAGANS